MHLYIYIYKKNKLNVSSILFGIEVKAWKDFLFCTVCTYEEMDCIIQNTVIIIFVQFK